MRCDDMLDALEGAACRGAPLEWFYPETHGAGAYDSGRALCARCTVRRECLEFAMACEGRTWDRHGLYAGLSPRQRRELAREGRRDDAA